MFFSKYGWLIPLKNKTGLTVSEAFKTLFKERKPIVSFGQIRALSFTIDR